MQIVIQPQSMLFVIIGICFAGALTLATYWLLNETVEDVTEIVKAEVDDTAFDFEVDHTKEIEK
jgi:hypothetical protein